MALSVRLMQRDSSGKELWRFEPYWWHADTLRELFEFRDVSRDAGYSDFERDFTSRQAWRLQYLFTRAEPILDHERAERKKLDELLHRLYFADDVTVTVLIFEWESGLG